MRIISLKIIESEMCQCNKAEQAPAKKSQKRPAADAAEEAAAVAAAEARLMEISFHILCFHGNFLPPILRSVVALVVMPLCTSSCARQIQIRRSE